MGCDVGCPYIGREFDDNWGLQDPTGQNDEVFINVIHEIEENILQIKNNRYGELLTSKSTKEK